MFWYSDCVVTGNASVTIDIFSHIKSVIGSDIHIYNAGNVVYTGKFDSLNKHIELVPIQNDIEFYTIIVSNKGFHVSLPFTAMKLSESDRYIVCDIDFTISATNALLYMMKKIVGLKTIGNSVEVLNRLSSQYRIIYLTGRIERFTKMSHTWLEKNGYPVGPILARPKTQPLKLESFKTEILKKITAISPNGVGIGDLKSDILAYITANVVPIKIMHPFYNYNSTNREYVFKNGYYLAKSWYGIEHLFEDKSFFVK